MKTPLWQALSAHVAQAPFSTHTPGHKSGQLIPAALKEAWGEAVWHYDLTEVPGLDNLAHPEGVLKESMAEWARERECANVQYLLGGTSLGLKAAILGLCRGQEVFVPRHAHGSIYQGLVLAGATPIPLDVTFDPQLDIPVGVDPEAFQEALCCNPNCRTMVMVHPTYHGITGENETLLQMAHAYGVTTIVDAAHGAHFTSDVTPKSALAMGADVVIESAHKILPCLTQASVMLIRDAALVEPLRAAVGLLHTTSPSYLLMASLEAAGAWLAEEGDAVMRDGLRQISLLEAGLAGNPHLNVARNPAWKQDPFKIYLTSPHAGGETISEALADHGVTAEMSDGRGCLLMMPLDGGSPALREAVLAAAHDLAAVTTDCPRPCYSKSRPETVVPLSEAWLAPRQTKPLCEAVGDVCAAILEAYPPGIPLLLPGQRITEQVLQTWTESGRDANAPVEVLITG